MLQEAFVGSSTVERHICYKRRLWAVVLYSVTFYKRRLWAIVL